MDKQKNSNAKNDDSTVCILMATYNGENFLRQQLDSILAQSYGNWMLFVRDDGSKDDTVKILEEYYQKDRRITYVVNDSDVHGWQFNFQRLIQTVETTATYYMFCDHDDIWYEDKLGKFVDKMSQMEDEHVEKPLIVYADMKIIDENNSVTKESFNELYNICLNTPMDVFFSQRIYGCNMMFNRRLLEDVRKVLAGNLYRELCHDGLMAKVLAAQNGVIAYINDQTMGYRRYGKNATANQEFSVSAKRVMQRVGKFDKLASDQSSTYRQSVCVIKLMEAACLLSASEQKNMLEIKNAIEKGGMTLARVWMKYHIGCGQVQRTVSHFLVLFSGKHRKYLTSE